MLFEANNGLSIICFFIKLHFNEGEVGLNVCMGIYINRILVYLKYGAKRERAGFNIGY